MDLLNQAGIGPSAAEQPCRSAAALPSGGVGTAQTREASAASPGSVTERLIEKNNQEQ